MHISYNGTGIPFKDRYNDGWLGTEPNGIERNGIKESSWGSGRNKHIQMNAGHD